MNAWSLPTSLNIGGVDYAIRTDFRDVLRILHYFSHPDYTEREKWIICLKILYKDFDKIPQENASEFMKAASEFIDNGIKDDGVKKPEVMDWDHDAAIIIPAINKVLGSEIRSIPYMHWWTFLGAYMEIGEGVFSSVVSIRTKKAKGEKLEKWERDYYRDNKALIDLPKKISKEERDEKEHLLRVLGG